MNEVGRDPELLDMFDSPPRDDAWFGLLCVAAFLVVLAAVLILGVGWPW